MIRPLRVRHRRIFLVLAIVTPLLYAAGLAARRPIPSSSGPGFYDEIDRHPGAEVVARDAAAWGDLPIRTEWLKAAEPAVRLERTGPLKHPDLLLYWDPTPERDYLSDSAYLLGSVGGRQTASWSVPKPVAGGRLVLYSLAHGSVVAAASPPEAWTARP